MANQQPPEWIPDEQALRCMSSECGVEFDWITRRHHCRFCGGVFCGDCSQFKCMLPLTFQLKEPQRVCQLCFAKLQPLQNELIANNANSLRTNMIEEDSIVRHLNSPVRFTLGGELRKAAYSVQNLIDGVQTKLEDTQLNEDLFQGCAALMFLTVFKAAFVGGIRFGSGLVVRRNRGPTGWSAPCAIAMAGVTFGAQIGAEVTDMIVPLEDMDAIEHFSVPGGSHALVGGEAGLALGPIGRTGEASLMASNRGLDTTVSYSHSKGLYGGMSMEGAVVRVRDDVNLKFYGYTVDPRALFEGQIAPPKAADPLYDKLREYEATVIKNSLPYREPGYVPAYPEPPLPNSTGGSGNLPVATGMPAESSAASNYSSFADMSPEPSRGAGPNPFNNVRAQQAPPPDSPAQSEVNTILV